MDAREASKYSRPRVLGREQQWNHRGVSLLKFSTSGNKKSPPVGWSAKLLEHAGCRRPNNTSSRGSSRDFLSAIKTAAQQDGTGNISAPSWAYVREFLTNFSTVRAKGGFTPSGNSVLHFLSEPAVVLSASSGARPGCRGLGDGNLACNRIVG